MDHNISADNPGLDTLALVLDRENSALRDLEYRLNSLRLALIDGNADFVSRAASEADVAAIAAAEFGVPREAAVGQAAAELGVDAASTLAIMAEAAPAPHRELLIRLVQELAKCTHGIRAQRDAVRTLADNGRRTAAGMIDLDDSSVTGSAIDLASDGRRGTLFVGDF